MYPHSLGLLALLLGACGGTTSQAQPTKPPERRPDSSQQDARIASIDDCDIDIRPTLAGGGPKVTVSYQFSAKQEPIDITIRVTNQSSTGDVALLRANGTVVHSFKNGDECVVAVDWSVDTKSAKLTYNTPTASSTSEDVTTVGAYDGGNPRVSPHLMDLDAKTFGILADWHGSKAVIRLKHP